MKNKINIATIMLATALILSGCNNETKKDDSTKEETKVEETATDNKDEQKEEENKEASKEETKEDSEKEEENKDDQAKEEAASAEGNLILHRGYPHSENARSFPRIVVATSADKIVSLAIDEYQYYNEEDGYKAVPNSDKGFGEGAAEGKVLVSKLDNEEKYTEAMKEAGSPTSLKETYEGIANFVKGKTIKEIEDFLKDTSEEDIIEAVSGATFKSTPTLLNLIVEVAKNSEFQAVGHAENPENIELKFGMGAPHGEKSFGDCVVALEDGKIIAASFDEFQYIDKGLGITNEDDSFTESYKERQNALVSKLENNEEYSKLMTEKSGSKVTIKDNYEAIQNFVAGKTVDEVKEAISTAKEDGTIDAVSGATLKDTAGYLQMIVDVASK